MLTVRRYRTRRSRSSTRGFTLLETLIVVMYIAIIAMMIMPNITGVGRRASETNLKATLREMRMAIGAFQAETGLYPCSLEDLVTRDAPDVGLTARGAEVPIHPNDFRGPYLIASGGRIPKDRTTGEREWDYSTSSPTVGGLHSKNPGTSLDGVPYAEL